MSKTVYLVMESPFSREAADGLRDTEKIAGAPWSRIVFKKADEVDPFRHMDKAAALSEQCIALGVRVQVVPITIDSEQE